MEENYSNNNFDNNDFDNNDNEIEDDLDVLSDDALWDLLDNFTNEKENDNKKLNEKNKENKCTSCGSDNIIFSENRNRNICKDCGNVCDEILDDNPEWNNHEEGKKDVMRGGTQINTFFPKTSLGTTISYSGWSRIKMLHSWGQMPYKERSLAQVLTDIDNKCKKYKITKSVIDNAKILYRNIRESKHQSGKNKGKNIIIRGINRRQIISACVYYGANLQNCTRSNKEIADIFDLEIKQVTKGCRKFLEYMQNNQVLYDIKPSHGTDFINRVGGKLNLDKQILELANIISNNTTKLDIATNHQPTSIAAASIVLAANILNKQIVKKDILKEFQISEVTINKTYNNIYNYKHCVINNEMTNQLYYKMQSKLLVDTDENHDILSNNNIEFQIIDNNKEIAYDNDFDSDNIIEDDDIMDLKNNIIFETKIKKKRGRKPKNKNNVDEQFITSISSLSMDNTDSITSNLTTETTETTDNSDSITNIIKKKRGRPRKIITQNESTN